MRTKIYSDIDTKLLDKGIAEFVATRPYRSQTEDTIIIMSKETMKALSFNEKSIYQDCKIAVCEFIPYGEVDIR